MVLKLKKLVFLLLLIKIVENCKTTTEVYFPVDSKAIAIMTGSINGSAVTGLITFQQKSINDPLKITVNLTGLPAGQGVARRGLHVHLTGLQSTLSDVTSRCGSAGAHFNPNNQTHGDISAAVRHVGDYGNVISDNNGNILTTFNDTVSKLYGPFGIIGRAIVLHELRDDLGLGGNAGSLATGNSGNRIACGVIGIA